jgi:hypothetical protein
MGNVYYYSYLTIAAAAAKDCNAGIFIPRVNEFDPLRFEFSSAKKGVQGSFYLRGPLQPWNVAVGGDGDDEVPEFLRRIYRSKINSGTLGGNAALYYQMRTEKDDNLIRNSLSSRAWVLQESLPAPRTLHYGSEQMFWECKVLSTAESSLHPVIEISDSSSLWQWPSKKTIPRSR